jgi:hypothetical protein
MDGGRREVRKHKRGRSEDEIILGEKKKVDEAAQHLLISAWNAATEQMRSLVNQNAAHVELEVKLGSSDSEGRFTSSLAESEFVLLEKALSNSFSWIALPEKHSVDCMVNNNNTRLSFDLHNGLQIALTKQRISNNTAKLSPSLALRVSLSVETVVPLPPNCEVGMKREELLLPVQNCRKKARKTFLHRSARGVFQVREKKVQKKKNNNFFFRFQKVDLTRVETEGGGSSFEVEVCFVLFVLRRLKTSFSFLNFFPPKKTQSLNLFLGLCIHKLQNTIAMFGLLQLLNLFVSLLLE